MINKQNYICVIDKQYTMKNARVLRIVSKAAGKLIKICYFGGFDKLNKYCPPWAI